MRIKVKNKVIPTSFFLKIEGKGTLVGAKDRRKRDKLVELVGGQNSGPKASPRSERSKETSEEER